MAKNREKITTGLDHGLRLRHGIYHYRFSWRGMIQTGSCFTTNKREAEDYLARIKSKLRLEDIDVRQNKRATFKEAYDLYILARGPKLSPKTVYDTKNNYKNHWMHLNEIKIINLQPEIDLMYKAMVERSAPRSTQQTFFARLHSIIEFALTRKLHNEHFDWPSIKVPEDPTDRTLNEEQVQKWFKLVNEHCPLDANIIIRATYWMGLRISEADSLEWDNLSEDGTKYLISKQKNDKPSYQPVPLEVRKWILMKERKPGQLICPNKANKPHRSTYTHNYMLKISTLMGLKEPISHHVLRSSFCTNLLRKGAPLATVVKLARHSDGGKVLLKHYAKINQEDMWEALDLLDGEPVGEPEPTPL